VDTRKPNPGPPLTPADEFCACQTPSGLEYLRAGGVALLVICFGAGVLIGAALLSGQTWSVLTTILGAGLGWSVNRAAGRHRSVWLGVIAAASTLVATGIGYLSLRYTGSPITWGVPWAHLLMVAIGAGLAYRLAGPSAASRRTW
jgi:hypothetical protein